MSTHRPSLRQQLRERNAHLDSALRRRVGICLQTYKVIKNVTQLVGAGAGIYSMYLGADPMTAFMIIGTIIVGPEVLEYSLTNDPEQ